MMRNVPPKVSASEVLDAYFLETRAKLLEIAANLDRFDRAADAGQLRGDARLEFIRAALDILKSAGPGRAARILELYSTD